MNNKNTGKKVIQIQIGVLCTLLYIQKLPKEKKLLAVWLKMTT